MKINEKNLVKRNVEKNVKKNPESDKKHSETESKGKDALKYGPLPRFPGQRVWTRGILILGVLIYVWYFSKSSKETVLAKQNDMYNRRGQVIECSEEYLDDIKQYPGCIPQKCGRYVSDKIVTAHEVEILLQLANRVMALGGSKGGATIMDLHSGALSFDDKFINVYAQKKNKILTPTDLTVYKLVRTKIQNAIAETFGIDVGSLYLTHPTFFSKLSNLTPVTPHDEYWHVHIDKHTYESFHYTSLLYLNDYGIDFKGGRFVFLNDASNPTKNVTVEPRKGRVSMFTSGPENPHFVERVTEGLRFAITVSFTCDSSKAIQDPVHKM
ncbi:2-oxoglutarate and iron-dependent oxygenase domain-containing protein 3-like [Anoplophora glabripennis]|uniref:2-oxoglutarate and iron-dependent oxygenase domain-containing protein 3-like n=1 Tax=Anoplophora glabripennis TaxID=217634 RepID=UPI0008742DB9|nr:2-oxoglutarate and iron-dependent oxygenase domain-containing protein 3-like [Anoplophora glabripennis]